MKPWLKFCWQGTYFCATCLASFCLWTLWLGLVILLVFQIFIASSRELALPDFVLRSLEQRLAASGVRAEFGRASFDPTGRVLIEQARLLLPAFGEPVVSARSVYLTLDPWALMVGRVEPRELQVSGASLYVTAMLSPTGRSEPLVHDLDFTLIPGPQGYELPQLAGRIAALNVTAHGGWQTTSMRHGRAPLPPIPELLVRSYPVICRQLIAVTDQLAMLETPALNLVLTPSESRGAVIDVELLAAGVKLPAPRALTASGLRVMTSLPLLGDTPVADRIELAADRLELPGQFRARGVRAFVHGRLQSNLRHYDYSRIEAAVQWISGAGIYTGPLMVRTTGQFPALQIELATQVLDEPLELQGRIDAAAQSARFRAAGRFAPDLVDLIGRQLHRDLRRYISFHSAPAFDLDVEFKPGWKFAQLAGRISGSNVNAYQVAMDSFAGHITFDGRRFLATDAVASLDGNYARGSYEQNFTTREYRFLLNGRLNPPAISGWFREWWTNFWQQFDFTVAAPEADVDVHGYWGRGPETTVFVFADCAEPVIRGVRLDHAIARVFIRPHFYDAIEVFATHGGGAARGNFTRRTAGADYALDTMIFDFDSTLELPVAAGLVGPELTDMLKPFVFSAPPSVRARGHIDGPAAPKGVHREIHVTGRGTGTFTLYDFPLQHLQFGAEMRDDDIRISPVETSFAGGTVSGSVRLSGPAADRKLGFALSLREGSLRDAATILETFSARRRGVPPTANSAYIEGTAQVRVGLDLTAEGEADDPLSLTGTGHADLSGQGLGRIRLLGLLSELLNFTALRFDTLRTDFKIERNTLVFPHVNITGPDAAMSAHGSYLLDRKELDFNARIFPFQESSFILKSVVGLVLTPLSGVLEVKLTGRLDKPEWAFVIGPTNFLRSLFAAPAKDLPPAPNLFSPTPPVPAP
jgi:hypothetical protein